MLGHLQGESDLYLSWCICLGRLDYNTLYDIYLPGVTRQFTYMSIVSDWCLCPFHIIHGWPYRAVGRPGRAICNMPGVGSYAIAPP